MTSFGHIPFVLSLHYLVKCRSHAVIECAVGEWHHRLPLVFVLEGDILSIRLCDVTRVTFSETVIANRVCRLQLIISEPTRALSSMNSLL